MKFKDVVRMANRWATPLGTQQDQSAYIEDGILIDISVWTGTFNINLVVECADGRY